jgi:type IV pilus assembly protein PilY1
MNVRTRQSHARLARRLTGAGFLVAVASSGIVWPTDARAQLAGTSAGPLPNVLLLVDTSGSMERMGDGSLPSANAANKCKVGTGAADLVSEPNRWGMLLQALTGNLQPYFSCEEVNRDAGPGNPFVAEYKIGGRAPYDANYFMPYHRPMTGTSDANACAIAPYILPGASNGVGENGRGDNSLLASDFPDDAIASVYRSYLNSTGHSLAVPLPASGAKCIFDQAPDGQLDAARDYARFALMTFDNDINEHTGIDGSGKVDLSTVSLGTPPVLATPQPPFLGQWSYLRSSANPLWASSSTVTSGSYPGHVQGHPPACAFVPFEVGARDENAPPWEGRLVKFPNPDASLYDIQLVNDQIQKVLLASRPYGATPIDGMFDDARDYYWHRDNGPKDDKYRCRNKYIVLLTDGAPNLDLRPSCGTGAGDVCPYPDTAAEIAYKMKNASVATDRVTTFVIGFSVNGSGTFPGDGFPAGFRGTGAPTNPPGKNNCKTWYDEEGLNNPKTMSDRCNALYGISPAGPNQIPVGSTADACCKLNEIALKGSDTTTPTGPYFAESQADIVLSFGQIMANIIKSASTKTVPAFTPTAQFSVDSFSGSATSGQFIASFIPNAQRPWSGELDRTRYQCGGSPAVSSPILPQDSTKGDLMSVNLAAQSKAKERFFISVMGDTITGGSIDSAATMRPFANIGASPTADGIRKPDDTAPTYSGLEIAMKNDLGYPTGWNLALDIDGNTCKRSRAVKKGTGAGPRGTVIVPALDAANCTKSIWGFTTAYPESISLSGVPASAPAYDFNVRCTGNQSSTVGKCSVSGTTCNISGTPACPTGEVCVPECAALGAIYKSNPTVVGPPSGFLREEGFRTFQSVRRNRGITTFAATADGILHAFKAMDEQGTARQELWSFIPPAVLPRLASNYPSGNQILLDGSPIVRETIWNRAPGDTSARAWHTTLVAGLGGGGGGYYALNVTDADCGGGIPGASPPKVAGDCITNGAWEDPTQNSLDHVSTSGVIDATHKKGPHFLWQLTDVLKDGDDDKAKVVRKNRHNDEMVALFGKQTGTPAVGMIQVKVGGTERQIGVAILPGGMENPPVKGGSCPRGGSAFDMHDTSAIGSVRGSVRQWAKNCDNPVPGRGVTIVRLDTGEVIRHFGREVDTPKRLLAKTQVTPFDSPMIGTPVVYPDTVGVPIQKIFIGDADGTMWRIDLTNTDPSAWRASLFQDLYATSAATAGQPIQIPPVLSTDDAGLVVVNVATGDQDSIVLSGDKNYVYSITESRTGADIKARVNWYKQLEDTVCSPAPTAPASCQARVTGPMVVFDRTLYFATYTPNPPSGDTCGAPGFSKLWGLHYTERDVGATNASAGGLPRFCRDGKVDTATGLCSEAYVYNEVPASPFNQDVIPGVALRTAQSCTSFGNTFDESGSSIGFSSVTPSEYHLAFGVARPSPTNGTQAARPNAFRRPVPRVSTKIDAWALVVE